jgi:hypothetical protein
MKTFIQSIAVLAILTTAGCSLETKDEGEQQNERALAGYNGVWSSSYIKFEDDSCAFFVETKRTDAEFTLKSFLVNCQVRGPLGLYAPGTFALKKSEEVDRYDSVGRNAPEGAFLIKRANDKMSSGWVDTAKGTLLLNLSSDRMALANALNFQAQVRNGRLFLSHLSMREGVKMDSEVELTPDNGNIGTLQNTTPWQRLKLPPGARPSTSTFDQNYLYCSESTAKPSAPQISLVDYKGTLYKISPDKTIGEIGTIAANPPRQVLMAATQYGSAYTENGHLIYSLNVLMVGGRTTTMTIEHHGSNALLYANGRAAVCAFIQNDVFAGIPGWNP